MFSPDGKELYYLVRRQGSRAFMSGELWAADLESDRTQAVLPGVSMTNFDIEPDGKRVAYETKDADGKAHVWIAPLDRGESPKLLTSSLAELAGLGAGGEVYVLKDEGGQRFLCLVVPDETMPRRVFPEKVSDFSSISPRGDLWLSTSPHLKARPTQGGSPISVCAYCQAGWAPLGNFFYLRFRELGELGGGKVIAMSFPEGAGLPKLPQAGFQSLNDLKGSKVFAEIDAKDKVVVAPGPNPSIYAYVRATVQRNLFRVPLN